MFKFCESVCFFAVHVGAVGDYVVDLSACFHAFASTQVVYTLRVLGAGFGGRDEAPASKVMSSHMDAFFLD